MRLREDMQDPGWRIDDIGVIDLLSYLDLTDLVTLLKRHRSNVRNSRAFEVKSAIDVVEELSIGAIRNRVMHPVRPLEDMDYVTLNVAARRLKSEAPGMIWDPLIESTDLIDDPSEIANVSIAPFWAIRAWYSTQSPGCRI